jgi:hypothetical protein
MSLKLGLTHFDAELRSGRRIFAKCRINDDRGLVVPDRLRILETGERLLEEAKTDECQSGLAGFAGGYLTLKVALEVRKRPLEFVGSVHHRTCLSNAFDWPFQNVVGGIHWGQWAVPTIVPAALGRPLSHCSKTGSVLFQREHCEYYSRSKQLLMRQCGE